ncbi:plant-specific TFIIB-related protein PTF2 [Cynara cardunculus var. scolymus]|uniref:Cyclin-like protein n=1 Tax=Cynara cardunculus var. scolymus TaxID=59895 RepID=A0A103YEN1_CYNCS|nr:plant-specific TFIIB-related protein PTF2 [Cynara cardunculus var. scolymus]KVI07704.1 Cyclin-like protein [Cynara cardunculus var. scolymus]
MGSCKNCKSKSLITDSVTGNLECSSCGVVQDFDNYEQQTFNADGPIGTNVRLGTSGSWHDYSYRETKIYLAQKIVSDILLKLDLENRVDEVNNMIKIITEEEYGSGNWFNVLVGACIYVVMRKANKCLPLTSVCNCVGCDSYELGRMVYRVIDHLDLRLPDFDIVGLFDRVIKEWVGCRSNISKDKVGRMVKQGIFLLQCMIKWYVTTGRRPVPVVVAAIVFVCELNEVEVSLEDLASQLNVAAGTCKLRYKEILKRLVDVAKVHLPWGNDVSVKNIMKNAPIVIQYMEMKSMCNPAKQIKTLEEVGMDLDGLVVDSLNKGDENHSIEDYTHNRSQGSTYWANEDLERLNVSSECLSTIYLKYLDEYSNVKTSIQGIDNRMTEWTSKSDFCMDTRDFWCGDSELSKKLFLNKILEKDVGLNAMPPSFVKGCLKTQRRKEKIEAAKRRIVKIRRPSMAAIESADLCVRLPVSSSKRKRRDTDWEDFVIETLLLHQVKEEEIEKGYYNTLLDLHVFNSGTC